MADELTLTMNRMDALEILRGLSELSKKRKSALNRARKRGFRNHEAAELVMAQCSADDLLENVWKQYKEIWPKSE